MPLSCGSHTLVIMPFRLLSYVSCFILASVSSVGAFLARLFICPLFSDQPREMEQQTEAQARALEPTLGNAASPASRRAVVQLASLPPAHKEIRLGCYAQWDLGNLVRCALSAGASANARCGDRRRQGAGGGRGGRRRRGRRRRARSRASSPPAGPTPRPASCAGARRRRRRCVQPDTCRRKRRAERRRRASLPMRSSHGPGAAAPGLRGRAAEAAAWSARGASKSRLTPGVVKCVRAWPKSNQGVRAAAGARAERPPRAGPPGLAFRADYACFSYSLRQAQAYEGWSSRLRRRRARWS